MVFTNSAVQTSTNYERCANGVTFKKRLTKLKIQVFVVPGDVETQKEIITKEND